MRIVYCITRSDTIGGAQVHVADMAAWMQDRGHDVTVVVGGEGRFTDHLARRGLSVVSCRYLRRPIRPHHDVLAIVELARLLRRLRPDIVSLHSAKAGLLGRLASVRSGAKTIFTAHGWAFTDGASRGKRLLYRTLERCVEPLADRIIVVSEYDRRLALRSGVGCDDKLCVVHNGMPRAGPVRDHIHRSGPVRLVMVARMDAQKDHETLLRALATLAGRDWVLHLVGDGPAQDRVAGLVSALGLDDRVHLLGPSDDVADVLGAADVFVLTSHWEGFPRSILEAMRAGLPVVASDVGGVGESVRDGETGYLVAPEAVDEVSDRLARLLEDPAERARMGAAGRQRFLKAFSFERMAEATARVYRDAFSDSAHPGA